MFARPASGEQAPAWQGKVDARVFQNAAAGTCEFLVFLSEQADVREAAALKLKQAKGAHVCLRLQEVAHRAQAPILGLLRARGLAHRSFWLANMIWVRGDSEAVQTLGQRDDVLRILDNPGVYLQEPAPSPAAVSGTLEWNIAKVRAPEAWALGYTGHGVVIGGQDTGYQWSHAALVDHYRGWDGTNADHNYNWHDAIHTNDSHYGSANPYGYDTQAPCDDHSHGTHTMGTMVGDDGLGNQIGMAPGAKWIGCRNMDRGWGTPATYTECFEWFLAPTDLNGQNPDPSKAPDVINNSWGCLPEEGAIDPLILQTIVERVRAAGIVVVVSAGNSGPGAGSVSDPPAIYDAAFTVGATDSGDVIAGFSSRGPVSVDGSFRMKPDIAAPGVNVRSSVPGGYAGGWNGTSMAGPHVAGLVALLLSAHPELKGEVDAIERIIEQTAVPCGASVPNATYGWGRIDALAALGLADSDLDGLADWWEIWRGLSRFDLADATQDPDADGVTNLQECLAGTDPNDAASFLRMTGVQLNGADVFGLFTSVVGKRYNLERTDWLAPPAWNPVVSNIVGTGAFCRVRDPGGTSPSQRFYRVQVVLP
jgi:subtilisin family serine protease